VLVLTVVRTEKASTPIIDGTSDTSINLKAIIVFIYRKEGVQAQ